MPKVVVNRCFGGFSLSDVARQVLGVESKYDYTYHDDENRRDDPKLVKVVEELGSEAASGDHACLVIVEIPDDVGNNWHISDYDGMETIHENHRSW
jgi:hypothetical protein